MTCCYAQATCTSTLIHFRMPPFFNQRTKTDTNIRAHTSVFESFSTVHTSYEKTIRFRSPWETDYRVHDVSVFENLRFRRFRPSTLRLCTHGVVFLRVLYCSPSSRDQKTNENATKTTPYAHSLRWCYTMQFFVQLVSQFCCDTTYPQ